MEKERVRAARGDGQRSARRRRGEGRTVADLLPSVKHLKMSPCATTTILSSLRSRSHLRTHLARSSTRSGAKMPSLLVHEEAPAQCSGAGEESRGERSSPANSESEERVARSCGGEGARVSFEEGREGGWNGDGPSRCRTGGR